MTPQERKVINLLDLPTSQLKQNWLNSFDTVLADCDGVLWHPYSVIENSPEVVAALQALGKRIFLVTNNGMRTRRDVWERAANFGYHVTESDVIIPSYGVAEYLHNLKFKQRVYLIGSPAIAKELDSVGIEHFGSGPDLLDVSLHAYMQRELTKSAEDNVGAVIVGFDEHFSFCKILKASQYLTQNRECLFLATNADVVFKCPNSVRIPDTGAMLKAVEMCSGREAVQLGKPSPRFVEHLVRDGLIQPERTLMVGDSAMVDIAFGWNCGFQTLLVGSGQTEWSEVEQMQQQGEKFAKNIPQYYLPKLGDLLPFVRE